MGQRWLAPLLVAAACAWAVFGVQGQSEKADAGAQSLDVQIGMPWQGGYSCPGKVSFLQCYADSNGVLSGIIYENDAVGQLRSLCRVEGPDLSVVGEYTLDATESIIKVEACRGFWYGYSSVTFYTDNDRVLQCGTGRPDYQPSGFSSNYKNYWAYGAARQTKSYNLRPMEAVVESFADPDAFFKKKAGWGWESPCQTYLSPKQAAWSDSRCHGCQTWYEGGMTKNAHWGFRKHGGYRDMWNMYNSYYKHHEGNKYVYYFKDYVTYQKQNDHCSKHSCDYLPGYYFKELYPLAKFNAFCDKHGNIYNLFEFCWNKAYVPPPPPPVDNVLVTFQIIMAEGEPCPSDTTLYNILGQLVYQLGADYPELAGMQVVLDANTIECRREVPGVSNTTVTVDAFLTPPANMTVEELLFILRSIPGGTDLCTLPGEYCLPSVYSIYISYAANELVVRNQLTNKRVRMKMSKAHLLEASRR